MRFKGWGVFSGAILLALFLSGCGGDLDPTLVSHKNVVYVPPAKLFYCPVSTLPDQFRSNKEVATLLAQTYGNNVECHNNINAIHRDLLNQQKIFRGK